MFTELEPQEIPAVGVALDEPLLTAEDVARLLAVPRSSVYEYARRQHSPLPSITVGRHRRFYRSDVEVWLAEQRAGGMS
jgi:excisionase family DNA binding protein